MKSIFSLFVFLCLVFSLTAQNDTPCYSLVDYNESIRQNNPKIVKTFILSWNLFGYSCVSPLNVENAFVSFVEKVEIVKDFNGVVYLPEYEFNGIGDLIGGEGYQVKMNAIQEDVSFCEGIILAEYLGCTNCDAINFTWLASSDDGSCIFEGCTDIQACNYFSEATIDDGSCLVPDSYCDICSDTEFSYVIDMDQDNDQICDYDEIVGCIDTLAINFNSLATDPFDTCNFNYVDLTDWDNSVEVYPLTMNVSFNIDLLTDFYGGYIMAFIQGQPVSSPSLIQNTENIVSSIYLNEFLDETLSIDDSINFAILMNEEYIIDVSFANPLTFQSDSLVLIETQYLSFTVDDLPYIFGCTDSIACNYFPLANVDNTYCTYSDPGYNCNGSLSLEIGDELMGGIVFYVAPDANSVLLVSKEDILFGCADSTACNYDPDVNVFGEYSQEIDPCIYPDQGVECLDLFLDEIFMPSLNSFEWGCQGVYFNSSSSLGISNTEALADYLDEDLQGCQTLYSGIPAYQACIDFEYSNLEVSWYLPSIEELALIYENLHEPGLFSFSEDLYWSSSSIGTQLAYYQRFSDGFSGYTSKLNKLKVRPIRYFEVSD
tara:strand:+ start:2523 stop:4325 length:1803 start_codon:yes stop_codon:yes gene_type:complete